MKWLLLLSLVSAVCAAPKLDVTVGQSGLSSVRFSNNQYLARGELLVNAVTFTDSGGITSKGETHGQLSNITNSSQLLRFPWGDVAVRYEAISDRLAIGLEISNRSSAAISSISLDVLALQLPSCPSEFQGSIPMLATNIGAPTLLPLDFAGGSIVVTNDDVKRPLLVGMPWALNPTKTVFPVRINTGREPMYPNSLPLIDRPIPPGGKDSYNISLRFSPGPADVASSARDVIAKFIGANEFTLKWADRRPIASLIIATAATNWRTNPRGWFLDPAVDVITPEGIKKFHARLLAWADNSIRIMKGVGAQGMVTWDIEGEQFPHATTYIGDPSLSEKLAPEMVGVVDEYFERFRKAGLRVGVTIRPQRLEQSATGTKQVEVADPASELIRKIGYAKRRWGATLFYIDSNGDPGFPMSADVIRKVSKAFPDVLLMPEHKNISYYSMTAPYSESRGGFYATPGLVTAIYPQAFSVLNTADGGVEKHYSELLAAANRGDILMFRGWFDDPANAMVRAIVQHSKSK